MKVLITGGAGYVGSVLVGKLLDAGHTVRVLDPLMYGGDGLLNYFINPKFALQRGSAADTADLTTALDGVEAVVHLAALVGFPACRRSPELATQVNVGSAELLTRLAPKEIPIIYASTGSNYGAVDGICTEETPVAPLSHYAKTKCIAEEVLLKRENTIAFRFATAFGLSPRLRLDLLVNDFAYQAAKRRTLVVYEKNHMRSFIHVRDMAVAFDAAVNGRIPPGVYNVGTESCTKEHICTLLKERLDFFLHYAEIGSDEDARNYHVSHAKIEALGFAPKISLTAGIDEVIRGMAAVDIRNPYSNV